MRKIERLLCEMKFKLLLLLISLEFIPEFPAERIFHIGGLFNHSEALQQSAFVFAAEDISRKSAKQIKLNPHWETVSSSDAYQIGRKACDFLLYPPVALFGPGFGPSVHQVRSLADQKEIPHFAIAPSSDFDSDAPYALSVDLFPPPKALGYAVKDIILNYNWREFAFLHQDEEGLAEMQPILELSGRTKSQIRVLVRQLDVRGDFRPVLKELHQILQTYHFIVQADLATTRQLLLQASEMNMIQNYYHYIFTNLDLTTLDMEPFVAAAPDCNITGFRFVEDGLKIEKLRNEIDSKMPGTLPQFGLMQTSVAVIYDSIQLLEMAVAKIGTDWGPRPLSCDDRSTWVNGSTFMNFIKSVEFDGVTGRVKLDADGRRTDYQLHVMELKREVGFQELGYWNPTTRFQVTKNASMIMNEKIQNLENRTLIVTIQLEEPFIMYKQSDELLEGNNRYEGYCIDLLDELSKIRHFNYQIREVKDKSYGTKDAAGNWNGLVGELVRGEADLAVASLTISYSRSEVIDFTVPFMHLGISILFKKPEEKDPSLFTFLSPLLLDVWIYMLAAYVGVSLTLWLLARFSPYEWYNPHPCNPDTDVVENQFSLLNSFWFTVGSLMQQGSDLAPRAASTRLVAGIWWFFTLILISSYTANLAAFLTVKRMVSPIESADDLAKQTKIKYGSMSRGTTMTFFKESKIQTYERMWAFMESAQPSVFVNSSQEGIQRVKQGDYAYLMESSMLEYYVERDCELMQINGLLDSKGYGIGLPKGSPFREPISSAVLILQENTKLTALKEKWWKQKRGGGQCAGTDESTSGQNELGLANVGGVFVLLLAGLAIACVIAVVEFTYKARKYASSDRQPLLQEMWHELRFALTCRGSKKPAKPKVSTSLGILLNSSNSDTFVPLPGSNYHYDPVPMSADGNYGDGIRI